MKKKLLLVLAALLSLSVAGRASAQACPAANGGDVAYAREVITVSNAAVGFTATKYNDGQHTVKYAAVTLESNNIRISVEGAPPTATVGDLWQTSTNVKFFVCGQTNVQKFLAIRASADASLTVTYYAGTN